MPFVEILGADYSLLGALVISPDGAGEGGWIKVQGMAAGQISMSLPSIFLFHEFNILLCCMRPRKDTESQGASLICE